MNYGKSGIFSGEKKIDCNNLCLSMNFKNEKLENICEFIKLVEKRFIDEFAEDFVFDIYFDGEDVMLKPLKKKLQKIESYIDRKIDLVYDGLLKCDEVSNRAQYRKLIDESIAFGEEVDLGLHFNNVKEIKEYIMNNLRKEASSSFMEPMPQDIGLNFSCEYISREEEMDFGYMGSLTFNVSGYILDYKYDEFIEYLKNFLRESSALLHSQCANIFISDRKYSTDYYRAFGFKEEYDERCLLRGVEGINFVNKGIFEEIDKVFLQEFSLEECNNGFFITIDKPLEDINIEDKYKLRDLLNFVLIKGVNECDLIQFLFILGSLPVYLDEIILVEYISPFAEESPFAAEFEEGEIDDDSLSKYFVITSNGEAENFTIDPERFREYRFTF